jgi:hypothetical protein
VAPPDRVFLFAAPIGLLLAAAGAERISLGLRGWYVGRAEGEEGSSRTESFEWARALLWSALAGLMLARSWLTPTLWDPADRAVVLSVPDVVRELRFHHPASSPGPAARPSSRTDRAASEAAARVRVLVPLPCDVPILYAMRRIGWSAAVNGVPEPGETIYAVTRPGAAPESTLADQVVRLERFGPALGPWRVVAEFRWLTLHRAEGRVAEESPRPSGGRP